MRCNGAAEMTFLTMETQRPPPADRERSGTGGYLIFTTAGDERVIGFALDRQRADIIAGFVCVLLRLCRLSVRGQRRLSVRGRVRSKKLRGRISLGRMVGTRRGLPLGSPWPLPEKPEQRHPR